LRSAGAIAYKPAMRAHLLVNPRSMLTHALGWFEATPVGAVVLGPVNRSKRDRYLKSHAVRKLHLGCGGRLLPGWLNSDFHVSLRKLFDARLQLVQMNCARRLQLPDASFDG